MDTRTSEILEGFVVDLACIRRYPASEMLERGRHHTTACALMGHCVESGYGLVRDSGAVIPLDTEATPLILDAARQSKHEKGLRVRVARRSENGDMKTFSVEWV